MKEEIKIATPFNSGEPAFPCGESGLNHISAMQTVEILNAI